MFESDRNVIAKILKRFISSVMVVAIHNCFGAYYPTLNEFPVPFTWSLN